MPRGNQAKSYLAFDIGAESGRAVLAYLDSGILSIEEVHRFANEPIHASGSLHWDVAGLWLEMRRALAQVGQYRLQGIGVDTWGVDYALVNRRGELLENPYHYRDSRTKGVIDQVFKIVPREEIYSITGIQFLPFNSVYQLFAAKVATPRVLETPGRMLMIPDLFHCWMTGNAVCEFTNATTTQMVSAATRTWAGDLMDRLGLPLSLPGEIVEPGTIVGSLAEDVAGAGPAGTAVIAPASHDTASAVAAISAREGTAFISSGTWSLVGTEIDSPVLSADAMRLNFSNEGGVNGTTRLLKNVMGLWMLRGCRDSWFAGGSHYDYAELMKLAAAEPAFQYLVDPDDESFLSPPDMCAAIERYCKRTNQPCPSTPAAYTRAVLESLALKYRLVIQDLARVTNRQIDQIRIIGGGSKNRLLNQFTANATGKRVLAGPAEATALGNVAVQILATGEAASLKDVRAMIERSFPVEVFDPHETDQWTSEAQRLQHYAETVYA
jgi:rhamnulokinase